MSVSPNTATATKSHRPRWITVLAAAFVAGATAAVGINSFLDAHLSQRKPQVECEPIFVALRSLPQGAPVTVWDVALKDWPKAMLPASALRAQDSFDGFVLRHAVREGQPLLAVQLVRADGGVPHHAMAAGEAFTSPTPAGQQPAASSTQSDLWAPEESVSAPKPAPRSKPESQATVATAPRAEFVPPTPKPAPASTDIDPPAASTAAADTARTPDKPVDAAAPPPRVPQEPPAESVATTTAAQPPLPPEPAAPARTETKSLNQAPVVEAPLAEAPVAPAPADVDSPALAATQPPVGEPTPAPDISTMPSVVVQDAAARPTDEARGGAGAGGRFLVVPERIALQADTSFAAPRRPQTPAVTSPQRAKQPAPRAATGSRRDAAPRGQKQPTQQPSQQRTPAAQATGQRTWGSFFPNIAAGMEALGGQAQRTRSPADQKTPARR